MEKYPKKSQILGCLTGLAVGDALGYSVVSLNEDKIHQKYGPNGITALELDPGTGKALISAETQMALFTINGILWGQTRASTRGIGGRPPIYVETALIDWYRTQVYSIEEVDKLEDLPGLGRISWLLKVPELYAERMSGPTCMDVLSKLEKDETLPEPRSNSKGCGGLVRVIPLAVLSNYYSEYSIKENELETDAAKIAAFTHGHPVSEISAAFLVHLIQAELLTRRSLAYCVKETIGSIICIYGINENTLEVVSLVRKALEMTNNRNSDVVNIRELGNDWTAAQVLAIAIYCAVKNEKDFSAGVIAAVNHDSVSNVIGAITGAILGARLEIGKIDSKWTDNLELLFVIRELALDMYEGCQLSEYGGTNNRFFGQKYLDKRYKLAGDD